MLEIVRCATLIIVVCVSLCLVGCDSSVATGSESGTDSDSDGTRRCLSIMMPHSESSVRSRVQSFLSGCNVPCFIVLFDGDEGAALRKAPVLYVLEKDRNRLLVTRLTDGSVVTLVEGECSREKYIKYAMALRIAEEVEMWSASK